ncbi:BNR-4 repeat-containing protein [Glycomyces tritici]|uniref:BNR-4 repeat-containing protein n=1 Tax=Glycomyces tritici TaxID=2665176 RepID=A0ABT7YS18_9ACTN|nr:BNR-4 repeat-containing protein [Glycomyces tritici]MDN3241437.1 BNR-4 repeat-containing protein [Glycomyces tritici]MDN3242224.1 BNR-4 repeat-containing protein [Glycomyces tritici]
MRPQAAERKATGRPRRPLGFAVTAIAMLAALLALAAVPASAAAPSLGSPNVTTLTTDGRTALTYTGYMNGESFQQDGITTFNGYQYTAWWDQSGYVNLARRAVASGSWQTVRLTDYRTTSTDSHNTISIGISGQDGSIHLSFDMHSSLLKYRKSVAGLATSPSTANWSASSFGAVTNTIGGQRLSQATYPQFFRAPDGVLQMSIRTGASGAGDVVLFEYRNGTWSHLGQFLNGTRADNNAYLFGIEYDDTGLDTSDLLHVTWTVRETPNASTNHDIYYAYSKDQGRTWRNNNGDVVATTGSNPLVADSASLRVVGIGQNRGLMNQESQVVDSAGNVHVLASHMAPSAANDGNFDSARGKSVLVHYWRDKTSKAWNRQVLSYTGVMTRADIGVDGDDNLYIASGNSSTRRLSVHTASKASGWTDWATRYTSTVQYYSDPLLDHARLLDGVVSVFAPRYGGSQIDVLNWTVGGSGTQTTDIANRNSGKCVDIVSGSTADGAEAIQWTCHGGANQLWELQDAGGGYYRIVSVASGKCLDVNGASTADNAAIIQWTCGDRANQQWQLRAGGDHFQIAARHSGKCIDVAGASTANSARLHQAACSSSTTQQWSL